MSDIAIIGAGELGGSVAHVVARQNLAPTICLIDDAGRVAEGKALDISQAAPIEGFATMLSGVDGPGIRQEVHRPSSSPIERQAWNGPGMTV